MRNGFRTTLLALAGLVALTCVNPAAAMPAGPTEPAFHPAVTPMPGAAQTARSTRPHDEYWVALGRLVGDGQAEQYKVLVGKWTHGAYADPKGRSVVEVYRYYEQQLTKAGFEIVYACRGVECGEGGRKTNGDWWPMNHNRGYLVARLARATGDLWVSVHVHARQATTPVHHEIDVIETRAATKPPPPRDEADVATLARELEADGRVVLRGIAFVEGRPTLRDDSEPILQAIAELLARDPGLKLHVVVHDDHERAAGPGIDLTEKRAAALVRQLVRHHRVRPDRLRAAGVGPLAPVASHATEEGRELNRRVELVPQGGERMRESAARVGARR